MFGDKSLTSVIIIEKTKDQRVWVEAIWPVSECIG
jgi:hypothetical protein